MHRLIYLALSVAALVTACQQPLRSETLDERWRGASRFEELLDNKTTSVESKPLKRDMFTRGLLPPLQFDHPYPLDNLLVVERYTSEDEVRAAGCYRTMPPIDGYLACAWGHKQFWSEERNRFVPGCRVVMASDEILLAHGLDPEMVYRHEIGHCNGWGTAHSGGRDYR